MKLFVTSTLMLLAFGRCVIGPGIDPFSADAAGPETTARLLAEADATATRPWAERIEAYRVVLRARKHFDANAFRALRKLAALHARRDPHAQSVLAAWSSLRQPKNDGGTFLAWVRLARGLRAEGDLQAAHEILRGVIADGEYVGRAAVARALALLGEDAFDAGDVGTVQWAVETAEDARVEPVTRMALWGYLGLFALRDGDRHEAVRHQLRCWKLYQRAQGNDPKLARRAAKTWLDLPLRKALADDR